MPWEGPTRIEEYRKQRKNEVQGECGVERFPTCLFWIRTSPTISAAKSLFSSPIRTLAAAE